MQDNQNTTYQYPVVAMSPQTWQELQNAYIAMDKKLRVYAEYMSKNPEIRKGLQNACNAFSETLKVIQSLNLVPILDFIYKLHGWSIAFSNALPNYNPDGAINKCHGILLESHWFPYAIRYNNLALLIDFRRIVRGSRASKARVRKIDRAIFDYYDKARIECIKKDWGRLDLPEFQKRMFRQCINAYQRREYAIPVIVLSTQWEGIIYEKVNYADHRRNGKLTKSYLSQLFQQNHLPSILNDFYDMFIAYNCNSAKESMNDVPGRNSAAHGFFNRYPTRKAALNAILFTDLLLRVDSITLPIDKAV